MTMSEYEERFRSPTPSLHQTFAEARGPNRGRRWSQPFWVAAALVGMMSMTMKVVSHHTIHSGAPVGSAMRPALTEMRGAAGKGSQAVGHRLLRVASTTRGVEARFNAATAPAGPPPKIKTSARITRI
jgi:hypothetical protein